MRRAGSQALRQTRPAASGSIPPPAASRFGVRHGLAAREGDHRPRHAEIYDLQLRLHILPAISDGVALGQVPLNELTPELIRTWYAALVAERGRSVAAKAYVRLRQILTQAVNDDRIGEEPLSHRRRRCRAASRTTIHLARGAVRARGGRARSVPRARVDRWARRLATRGAVCAPTCRRRSLARHGRSAPEAPAARVRRRDRRWPQERGGPATGRVAEASGRRARPTPRRVQQHRRGQLRVHIRERKAARARQLPITSVGAGDARRWFARPSVPRPPSRRWNARRGALGRRRRS